MPDKATAHITRRKPPIGAVKDGKIKVLDGDTGKESWRSGRSGMSRDFDGDPISTNYNKKDLKPAPKHQTHKGKRPHKPHGT